MKKTAAFLGAALLAAATPFAAEPTVADRFGWMVGCWTGHRGPATFTEIWTGGGPDLLVGMSVTTVPGRAAEFEFLRIQTKDGRPVYVAQPGGAPPTGFTWDAAASAAETAVFANPQHDFPKRVAYKKVDPTHLLAWIDDGGTKKMEYPMERGACPGGR